MSRQQRKILHALSRCRTAELGGHLYQCSKGCGYEVNAYNSCRDRHCPKCQGVTMYKWVAKRLKELLPVPYFHTIFTMSHDLNILVPYNERVIYDTLFEAASSSLKKLAHKYLGGTLGVTAVLHTWGQKLNRHIHLHCLVTGGALSSNQTRWMPTSKKYLFDVFELSELFRELFCKGLRRLYSDGLLKFKHKAAHLAQSKEFEVFVNDQEEKEWVVYCKKPFAGSAKVVEYLGRYTHRIALSNRRIQSVDDGHVTFDYKDYGNLDSDGVPCHKALKVTVGTFIKMFLQHVLPKGFRKIRYYGLFAARDRAALIETCRTVLQRQGLSQAPIEEEPQIIELPLCPDCGAPLCVKASVLPRRVIPITGWGAKRSA